MPSDNPPATHTHTLSPTKAGLARWGGGFLFNGIPPFLVFRPIRSCLILSGGGVFISLPGNQRSVAPFVGRWAVSGWAVGVGGGALCCSQQSGLQFPQTGAPPNTAAMRSCLQVGGRSADRMVSPFGLTITVQDYDFCGDQTHVRNRKWSS